MTSRKIARIGDLLPTVLKQLGLEQRFKEQELLRKWPVVVGDELASRTRATRMDNGVLYVHVDHGAWMQELHFIEKQLIDKLCNAVPGVVLERIHFSARHTS